MPQAGRSLLVSLLTWEAAQLTIDCLASVAPEIESVQGCRVTVVDNGSLDGSDELVERAIAECGWDSWATFVRAPGNYGFSAGNNVAIEQALHEESPPDFILLLNPDTIVRPGAFRILVDFMVEHPHVGIAGGRSENPDGTPQTCCFQFPTALGEFSSHLKLGIVDRLLRRFITRVPIPEHDCEMDWVSGALMIVRKEVFDDIGLLDDGYFLYYEDLDFALRAHRAGWPCWHVPASRIVHFVGHSYGIGKPNAKPKRLPSFWYESRHRYFFKNHGLLYAAFVDVMTIVGCLMWTVRCFLQGKPNYEPPMQLIDLVRHSVFVRGCKLNTNEEARPAGRSGA